MTSAEPATYYQVTSPPRMPAVPQTGEEQAHVAIVGGGLAGINTALSLAERGIGDIVVLEAARIGHGASGRNGGFVFAGYSLGEKALLDRVGADKARRLYACTTDAVERIRARIDRYHIACDAVNEGVILANWFRDERMLRERQRLLAEHYHVDWLWCSAAALAEKLHAQRYHGGLFEPNAMHLHPLKYLQGLAQAASQQGVVIHESSPVRDLRRQADGGWKLRTPRGSLRCRHVVLACGGYLAHLQRTVDRAVLPIATCVMVTEPLGPLLAQTVATAAAVYDTRFAFDYYHTLPDTRLLWGGRISIRRPAALDVARQLRSDLAKVYPVLADIRIDHAWSGLMSYARHEMPQLGTFGNGLWWAQAFGGHGLAPTTAAGELLAEGITGQSERWRDFEEFGLVHAWRPLGYLAAQARYAWLQWQDRRKDRSEP